MVKPWSLAPQSKDDAEDDDDDDDDDDNAYGECWGEGVMLEGIFQGKESG